MRIHGSDKEIAMDGIVEFDTSTYEYYAPLAWINSLLAMHEFRHCHLDAKTGLINCDEKLHDLPTIKFKFHE
jgi:hypothetical protein